MLYQLSFHAQCRQDWPVLYSNCCHLVGFWQRSTFSMTRNLLPDRQIFPKPNKEHTPNLGGLCHRKKKKKLNIEIWYTSSSYAVELMLRFSLILSPLPHFLSLLYSFIGKFPFYWLFIMKSFSNICRLY